MELISSAWARRGIRQEVPIPAPVFKNERRVYVRTLSTSVSWSIGAITTLVPPLLLLLGLTLFAFPLLLLLFGTPGAYTVWMAVIHPTGSAGAHSRIAANRTAPAMPAAMVASVKSDSDHR